MKRIIVPVDFSPYSENAFLTASKIAAKGDASITCVNAITSELDWKHLSEAEKAKYTEIVDLEAEAKGKLKEFIATHKVKNTPIEAVVEVGMPAQVLVDLAERQKADLIVIGAYGKGYESGKFIGSTTQKVMREANCPVLAVKKVLDGRAMKKMVFASLFNEASRPAFTRMKPLIKTIGASVYFLFINTPDKFTDSARAETLMRNYASGQEDLIIHRHIYNHEEAEKGIVAYASEQNAGIIAIASNVRKSSASYQIGVTDTVLFKSDIPVLSVKFE
ncbi:Nucleotide-binding universal stress protein, UspA family [Cyclobacterium xiamenense]|uniref:Nucleotide-binding universal stress protein, UspA family n=1 Tax=Cyclobacterium xiamenense TaxID=1297121 RepID=A0A1H7BH92_9BACT|nr:universal stress protein [Cyclobacterium xiamenense]SEJ77001.1 Nucleotide-binding universal stress protein, UspA family [Cyclobacterium xiamenense]